MNKKMKAVSTEPSMIGLVWFWYQFQRVGVFFFFCIPPKQFLDTRLMFYNSTKFSQYQPGYSVNQIEEIPRARCVGRRAEHPRSLSMPLSPNNHVFINREALAAQTFQVFMEASLHRHCWLHSRPLVIELNLQLHCFPRRSRVGTKSFTL